MSSSPSPMPSSHALTSPRARLPSSSSPACAPRRVLQQVVESFQRVRKGVSLEQVWERIQSLGAEVLTWDDDSYPRHLKEIDQPPPVLYVRGSLTPDDDWAVAIVGTRRA